MGQKTGIVVAIAVLWAFAPCGSDAAGRCSVNEVAMLPITMDNLQPTFPVKINGKDAQFILDSGAFYSTISAATASQYALKTYPAPFGFFLKGFGGSTAASLTTVKEFTIVGAKIKNLEFLVGGGEVGHAGLMGQNLLSHWDVEYDLGKGAIRLFQTDGCANARLAYWLTPGQSFSEMSIEPVEAFNPHTIGTLYLNGRRIKAVFDTGAGTSMLTLKAATRAGVTLDSPGVVANGYGRGLGRHPVSTYIATFSSFKVGDGEEIKNAKLRVADGELAGDEDMLLGADFFLSHRVFVASKEHKLFLTYNGGPVFDLSKRILAADSAAAAPGEDNPTAAVDAGAAPAGAPPGMSATQLARRGEASASRRDFAAAVLDLSQAIELNPKDPQYYFARANAYRYSGKADAALADFDRTEQLQEDFLAVYLPRAELKLAMKDEAGALADMHKLDMLAPPQADVRFDLARAYAGIDRMAAVVDQYSLWLKNHPDDARFAEAAAGRCRASTLLNQDLERAMGDCNAALVRANKKDPSAAILFTDRGLVYLRQRKYDKALSDFNAALKLNAKSARALYGRGVIEARLHQQARSSEDLQVSENIAPQIAKRMASYGVEP